MIEFKILKHGRGYVSPKLTLDEKALEALGKAGEASVLDNIKTQKQTDGSRIKLNAPSTRERKRARGGVPRSLVDLQHRFVKGKQGSWAHVIDARANSVTIKPATTELRDLSLDLQQRGYVGWMGLSVKGVEAVRRALQSFIKRAFRGSGVKR